MITTQVVAESANYERAIIHIVRTLPRDRVAQILDFARFLQTQPREGSTGDANEVEEDLWGQASIRSLARYWDTPEEDEAWAHL